MPTPNNFLRAQVYDEPVSVQRLRQFHAMEQQIAGLFATETCHPPHFKIPRHSHDLMSFYLVLDGGLTEFFEGDKYERRRWDVVLTPSGKIHANLFHDEGGRCFQVELSDQWTNRLSDYGIELNGHLEWKSRELTQLTARLYQELRHPDIATPLSVEGLALEILASFSRQAAKSSKAPLPSWLRQAKNVLHDRFADSLSLEGIARDVGVHPVHLARTFRKRFSVSVGEYQRQLRIEFASRQLATTRRPIAAIASASGFADQAHFSRVFKAQTGFTPKSFRAFFGRG